MKLQFIAIAFLFLAACERSPESSLSANPSEPAVVDQRPSPNASVERHLIKNGSLEFETGDWKNTKQKLRLLCDSLAAYTSDESLSNLSDRVSYNLIIRIPTARFEELVEKVEKFSMDLDDENIKVDDVTREYIDVEVRIKNKKEMEQRYRELLERATTVEEMLKVERYITDVRTDIERMEASLKNMQDQIAFSTLEVTFYEMIVTDFGFWSKMAASLSYGWRSLQLVIIGLANIWPFLILLAAGTYWLRRHPRPEAESRLSNTIDS